MRIVAVMPIKLNNERLSGKNTILLNGKPLLQYNLDTLSSIDCIEKVYVYCSNKSIADYLPNSVQLLERPACLDLPTTNFTQIFESFSSKIDSDIYVYSHATAPFISVETITKCIVAVVSNRYDSAFTATKIQDFVWINNKPNYDLANIPRTQDIAPIYVESSGVYVFSKSVFSQYRRRIGANPFICEISNRESVDINYPQDLELAKAWLKI